MVCFKTFVVEASGAEASGLSAMLSHIGHEVCGVAGNVSGLAQLFERTTPDLIALDLNLDEGNEARGLATVLQATGPIPIVFVTGSADWPERDGIRSIVGTALLIRPFGVLELRTAIALAFERARAARKGLPKGGAAGSSEPGR
jgi:DNA-binding response OmpR family regulator